MTHYEKSVYDAKTFIRNTAPSPPHTNHYIVSLGNHSFSSKVTSTHTVAAVLTESLLSSRPTVVGGGCMSFNLRCPLFHETTDFPSKILLPVTP